MSAAANQLATRWHEGEGGRLGGGRGAGWREVARSWDEMVATKYNGEAEGGRLCAEAMGSELGEEQTDRSLSAEPRYAC